MPSSVGLSREKIAAAALELADRDGLEALSMRRLAAELGVGTMSLYNHVRDKADLEKLLLDRVFASESAASLEGDWEARVKTVMRSVRATLERHPGLVPLLLKRPTSSEAALRGVEALLAALADGGFEGRALLRAYHTLYGFLTGFILTDLTGAFAARNRRSVSEVSESVRALAGDRFPHLTACAKIAAHAKPGEEFEYGLSAVLAGLKAVEGLDD